MRKTSEERRDEIALAVLEIMGEHGVEGATVARIAESVGMTHGALYRHFESRNAMLAAANVVAMHRSMRWFDGLESRDALDQLKELISRHSSFAREHMTTTTRTLFRMVASVEIPEFQVHRDMERWPAHARLLAIAEEARQEGSIRADVDPEDVAWAVLMFAFDQNMALLMGNDRLADTILVRNMHRLLDSFCPPQPTPDSGSSAPSP